MLRDDDFRFWYLKDLASKITICFYPLKFGLTMQTHLRSMRDNLVGVVYLLQSFTLVSGLSPRFSP